MHHRWSTIVVFFNLNPYQLYTHESEEVTLCGKTGNLFRKYHRLRKGEVDHQCEIFSRWGLSLIE